MLLPSLCRETTPFDEKTFWCKSARLREGKTIPEEASPFIEPGNSMLLIMLTLIPNNFSALAQTNADSSWYNVVTEYGSFSSTMTRS